MFRNVQYFLLQISVLSVSSGYAPLSVQFTDLSQNAASWYWDFGMTGILTQRAVNPVYAYGIPAG